MSSYNGEKYIRNQIESILNQEDVSVELIIRDDGSVDNTVSLIEEYNSVTLIKGEHIGCERSFMELLYSAPTADYYAFSDQDDMWLNNKLKTAIDHIDDTNASLYACNLTVCDSELNIIKNIYSDDEIKKLRILMNETALINMHGCTLVWNQVLQNIIIRYKPQSSVAHDTWVNTIGNLLGNVYLDPNPYILYRIHDNNVSGYGMTKADRLSKALRLYLGKNRRKQDVIAKEIIKGYGLYMDRESSAYKLIECISNYHDSFSNKYYIIKSDYITHRPILDICFWILCIMLNKF